jgi:hypothetical protein
MLAKRVTSAERRMLALILRRFPVLSLNFPVLQNIFLVNLQKEFLEKSLQPRVCPVRQG